MRWLYLCDRPLLAKRPSVVGPNSTRRGHSVALSMVRAKSGRSDRSSSHRDYSLKSVTNALLRRRRRSYFIPLFATFGSPALLRPASQTEIRAIAHIAAPARNTVMIVDDQSTRRTILEQLVRTLDDRVIVQSFASPVDAVAWATRNVADLVLVDYLMPEVDGIELVRRLRSLPGFEHVPIVMITVVDDRKVRYLALEAGVTDFLIHPVDVHECQARCRNLLTLRRQQLALEDRRLLLEGTVEDLNHAHALLEQRVAERTADLEKANLELAQHRETLREDCRRKDEFIAIMSHELRNPVQAIRTAACNLLGGGSGVRAPDVAAIVDRQSKNLGRMLDDLLDVSCIKQHKIRLALEPLDLCEVIENAVADVRPKAEQRGITILEEFSDTPLRVVADRTRIEQVLCNLLLNAIKYSFGGGSVTMRAARQDDRVTIAVRDFGAGIRSDMLPKIFNLFSQDPDRDPALPGLGIGLYLSQSIVHLHRGTIVARSEGPGRGSEFSISLPAQLSPETAGVEVSGPAPSYDISSSGSKRRRILIVDDNVDVANGLATLLVASGHEVVTAYDGPAALNAVIAAPPEFVLLDIGMPGMDGYKVAQQMRANQQLEGMRIIAITGYGEDAARERTRQAGFDLHLTKPIDLGHLLTLVG